MKMPEPQTHRLRWEELGREPCEYYMYGNSIKRAAMNKFDLCRQALHLIGGLVSQKRPKTATNETLQSFRHIIGPKPCQRLPNHLSPPMTTEIKILLSHNFKRQATGRYWESSVLVAAWGGASKDEGYLRKILPE